MTSTELNSDLDTKKQIEGLEKEEPQKKCETDYVIRVFTSDLKGAGTKSNCFIQLIGTGGQTGEIELKSENGFHRNSLKEFLVDNERWIGPLRKVKIWHGGKGLTPEWHVSYVEVDDCAARRQYRFPCHEWVRHDTASTSKELRCMESKRGQMFAIQPATGVSKLLFPIQVSTPGHIQPENEANSTGIVNTQSSIMVYGKKKQAGLGSQRSSRSSSVKNSMVPPAVVADPNGIENPNVRSHKAGNKKEMYPGGHGPMMGLGPPGASGMGQGQGMGGYGSMAGRPPAQNMGGHAGGAGQVPPGYNMQYQGMHGAGAGAYAQPGGHYGQGGQAYGSQMMAGGGPPMPQPSYGASPGGGYQSAQGYPGSGYGHKGGHQMAGYGHGGGMAGYGQGGGMYGYGQGGGMAGYGQGGGYQMTGYGQGGGHQMAGYGAYGGSPMGGQHYGGHGYGSGGQYGGSYGWGQQAPQQYGGGYGW